VTVLAAEVELAPELGEETEEDLAGPFTLTLRRGKQPLAEAPIGIYRLPRRHGEAVTSEWPAEYHGPLEAARAWELRTPSGRHVAGLAFDFPKLWRRDSMNVTVTLWGRRRANAV
jgi:hypothetical protein